jgi:hypothetical protein
MMEPPSSAARVVGSGVVSRSAGLGPPPLLLLLRAPHKADSSLAATVYSAPGRENGV